MNRPMRAFAAATLGLLSLGAAPQGGGDLSDELPRIKPLGPKAALESFQIPHGFRLVPIATEPLVTDPVSLAYDADGRAYVVEMRGYPYPENQPSGNVSLLTDKDGDGVFDARTIFVDGLSWPTGVVPYDGGVYIAVAPDILYAKDTDGDGVADVRRKVFTGFGTQNVQGLLNGLLWGNDGWIYGSSGSNGGDVRNLTRPGARPVVLRGRDFRFKPDASAFEGISGGGQFGHSLDDWGHRFVCNNSNHIRQVVLPAEYVDRNPYYTPGSVLTDIAEEGGAGPVFRISPAEPWRVVRTRQRAADPTIARRLPPTELHATGFFTSASGLTIYRGTAFPPAYRGNAFVGDVGGNLVHRKTVVKDGPIFKAKRADEGKEFLASRDNWFRPVNFANSPDGTLVVLDMYRETIEHPASIPEPIKKHLDLTSGKDLGRLYEIVPDGFRRRPRPRLSAAPSPDIVSQLANPDSWWRETAQRILIERRDPTAIALLSRLAMKRPTPLARVHALWTLDALDAVEPSGIVAAMDDRDANVREQGAKLAARQLARFPELERALLKLADDPEAMVRLQVAFSLGAARGAETIPALAKIAHRDPGDRWIRAAVLSSVAGRADLLIGSLEGGEPGERFFATASGRAWLTDLSVIVGAENAPGRVAKLLRGKLQSDADPAVARGILLGVARGLRRAGASLEGVVDPEVVQPYFKRAELVARGQNPILDRIEAIGLLGVGSQDRALEVLPELLGVREPKAVQLAAIQALNASSHPKVGPAIIARWKTLEPGVRREAIEALFARRDRLSALLNGLESHQLTATDLDPDRQTSLLKHPDLPVRERARKFLGETSHQDRAKVVAAFQSTLTLQGVPERGRTVFKTACATCHVARELGIEVGPNLATVANRTPQDILVHILDPNREVAANFVNYSVSTTDGRVVTGLIAEETSSAITLKRAEGATEVIPRDRIESIAASGQSLMPEGLEKGLVPQDFADLIAFLKGLAAGSSPPHS